MDNSFIASYRQMLFSNHKCAPDHGKTSEPNSLEQVGDRSDLVDTIPLIKTTDSFPRSSRWWVTERCVFLCVCLLLNQSHPMRYAETSWHHMEPKNTETLEFKFIQKDGHMLQILNVSCFFFFKGSSCEWQLSC